MAHYRKVDTRIWNDEKFAGLSERGKLVFLFLLTHPAMTAVGAMRASIPGLAAELGIPLQGLRKGLREVFGKGFLDLDEKRNFIAFRNWFRYNKPESPNAIKGWQKAFDTLPECPSKVKLYQRVSELAARSSGGFREALREVFPNQEQEQEQEQEYKNPPNPPLQGGTPAAGKKSATGKRKKKAARETRQQKAEREKREQRELAERIANGETP